MPNKELERAEIEDNELLDEGFYDENDLEETRGSDSSEDESLKVEGSDDKVGHSSDHGEQLIFEEAFDFDDEPEDKIEDEYTSDLNDTDSFDESDYLDDSFELDSKDQNHFNEENGLAFDDFDSDELETDAFEKESDLAEQINAQIENVESEPDPLDEFNDIVESHPSGFRTKIIIASIALLLIVALTQIWTNRQAIAWNDTWGPMMKTVCNALPCKLKPKRAINEIKLLQRQVSPHQEKEKTLDIKVLLVNQAKFAQPYPVIKIAFSDKNGKEVAVKRFKPSNYLRNGSKNDLMPPNAEVHIQFDTKTPHPDALGFEFIFE